MRINFRPAHAQDFDYCERLYFAEMERTIRDLKLDRAAQVESFRRQWDVTQVRIILRDGADIGWLQSMTRDDALFLAQLFVEAPFQRQGIGTEVIERLIGEASRARQPMTLGVVKTNPALRLYERLGFRITHDDARKFYMQREPDVGITILGLTGSVGMGKSTTAQLFAEEGVPVHDSDAAVHQLYEGEAVPAIEAAFPGTTAGGKVDRNKLGARVLGDAAALAKLEAIVHPLVRAAADRFVAEARARGAPVVVLDIPLLFETGGEDRVDAVVVVSAPAEVQRARVLARPGMTPEKFAAILAKQLPDAEKRARADFVVDSSQGLEPARAQVRDILRAIANMPKRR